MSFSSASSIPMQPNDLLTFHSNYQGLLFQGWLTLPYYVSSPGARAPPEFETKDVQGRSPFSWNMDPFKTIFPCMQNPISRLSHSTLNSKLSSVWFCRPVSKGSLKHLALAHAKLGRQGGLIEEMRGLFSAASLSCQKHSLMQRSKNSSILRGVTWHSGTLALP